MERARVLVAPGLVARERLLDDLLELLRYAGADGAHRRGRLVQDRVDDRDVVVAPKRQLARHHFVEHDSQGPDVRPGARLLAPRLLGGHVRDGAHRFPRGREPRLPGELGEPEVDDLHRAVIREENVARFDVPVHDPVGVGLGEPVGGLRGDVERFREPERPLGDALSQRLALVIGHRDEYPVVLDLVDLEYRADVGMLYRGGRPRLGHEALLGLAVAGHLGGQKLEGDGAAELRVLGLVHDAHAAGADSLDDSVVRDDFADERVHGRDLCRSDAVEKLCVGAIAWRLR